MPVFYSLFARALLCLPLLFHFVSTRDPAAECKVLGHSGPCIRTELNYATCNIFITCGDDCPPPAPQPLWGFELVATSNNPCPEDAATTASTVAGYYDATKRERSEGLYTDLLFYDRWGYVACNGTSDHTGGLIGCSQCQVLDYQAPDKHCKYTAWQPGSCSTYAFCLPNVCARADVGVTASAWHSCQHYSTLCTVETNADFFGAWGTAYCSSCGVIFGDSFGFQNCNGQQSSDSSWGQCPCG
ncbi:MAG: hypothetical protein ACREBD_07450 [Blastocatellia bacterium]